MKQVLSLSALILTLFILPSCGASKQESSHSEQIQAAKEKKIINIPPPIPPNNCKVIATVETIDQTLKGTGEKDPCSKAPCLATVRIDSVLGFGSAFPSTMSAGKKIQVKFALTLSSTKEMLPEVTPALPGLSAGSRFEALINGSIEMGRTEPLFTIYGYEKK